MCLIGRNRLSTATFALARGFFHLLALLVVGFLNFLNQGISLVNWHPQHLFNALADSLFAERQRHDQGVQVVLTWRFEQTQIKRRAKTSRG